MSGASIDGTAFRSAFDRFRALVEAMSGHPFRGFDEGLAAAWEDYKPRLRDHALGLLRPGDWLEGEIGSGAVLKRTVEAIEIQDSRLNLTNNLVFWQNRFGHANRDHRAMLEAASNPALRGAIERLLFGLYRGGADEGATFDGLVDATGGKYPLLAYLFYLNDMDRYMPIQPTGFDRGFRALGIEFTTLRQCSWENYARFNATLDGLRPLIAHAAGLDTVRLVDAHSFCWIFSTLLKRDAEGTLERAPGGAGRGTRPGRAREVHRRDEIRGRGHGAKCRGADCRAEGEEQGIAHEWGGVGKAHRLPARPSGRPLRTDRNPFPLPWTACRQEPAAIRGPDRQRRPL